jgi:magnesium chelatase family protein
LLGVNGRRVSVEVHVTSGLPSFCIVGLPDAACRESRDRVRAAILSSGLSWPGNRVTVNLAPSGVRKGGPGLDLPIAIAVLVASEQVPAGSLEGHAFVGELGLNGSVRAVPGMVSLADAVASPVLVVPAASAAQAALVGRAQVRPVSSLDEAVKALRGRAPWPPPVPPAVEEAVEPPAPDLVDVRGQRVGRRAV